MNSINITITAANQPRIVMPAYAFGSGRLRRHAGSCARVRSQGSHPGASVWIDDDRRPRQRCRSW